LAAFDRAAGALEATYDWTGAVGRSHDALGARVGGGVCGRLAVEDDGRVEGRRRGVRGRVNVRGLLGVCGAEWPQRGVLGHEAARDTEREQGERWADVAGA
jgi:hypothetical protein